MIIGLIADTHIPRKARQMPGAVMQAMAAADLIIHAGDIVDEEVVRHLTMLAPVHAVAGNADPPSLREKLGTKKIINLEGKSIGIIHGDGQSGTTRERALKAFPQADCIIFGHSHRPLIERAGKTLLVNPGSPTDKRLNPSYSYGLLFLDKDTLHAEIIYLGRRLKSLAGTKTVSNKK